MGRNDAGLKKAIVMDRSGLREYRDEKVMFLDELIEQGKAFEQAEAQFDDIYRSVGA